MFAELVGKRVEIESQAGDARFTDIGLLQLVERPWFRLLKDNGEILHLNEYHIRIVKPVRNR